MSVLKVLTYLGGAMQWTCLTVFLTLNQFDRKTCSFVPFLCSFQLRGVFIAYPFNYLLSGSFYRVLNLFKLYFRKINHRNDLMTVEISRQILFAFIGLPVEEILKEDIDEHSCLYPLDTEGAEGCLQKIVECPRQVGANPCPLSRVYASLHVYHSVS